jgi:hypothetical protein
MRPVLVLEINEMPWRLIDRYVDSPDFPHICQFFERSHQYTNVAVDTGELSPWVTWPTMHRGMNNEAHGIRNLGQNPSAFKGCPIWHEVREAGETIGVCGPMQSWPPIEPGPGGFYVPDTFAHDEKCFPTYLEPIQAVNLAQVKRNPRVISSSLPSMHEVALLLQNIGNAGIRTRTLGKIASQLLSERFDRRRVSRRPIYQTVLFWDVFRKHFKASSPPAYSSFFTNHIAGVMHRFWKDVFPEDFGKERREDVDSFEPLMRFSLDILDEMLADVLAWMEKNPALVTVFASSMGQAAIHREYHEGVELHITNVNRLLESTGLTRGDYVPLLAMVPQVAAEIADPKLREQTRAHLLRVTTIGDHPLFQVDEIGTSLSITMTLPPKTDIEAGVACLGGNRILYSSLGITPQRIESGTAYHIPEGAFALLMRENGSHPNHSRSSFRADRYKPWMMNLLKTGQHHPESLFS